MTDHKTHHKKHEHEHQHDHKHPHEKKPETIDEDLELENLQAEKPAVDPLAALTTQLQEETAKSEKYWDMLVRMKAEVENIQRRAQLDIEKSHKFGMEKCFKELLPVLDSLETGLANTNAEDTATAAIRDGMSLTLKLLLATLHKFGVAEIDPVGKPFDPSHHEAMSMVEIPDAQPNTVVTVVQKGYLLHGRLLRPARVLVAKAK